MRCPCCGHTDVTWRDDWMQWVCEIVSCTTWFDAPAPVDVA